MSPVGRLEVLRRTEKSQLLRAIALLTWPGLTAFAMGPLLGGLITSYFSWPWIFFINVPIAVVSLIFTNRLVEDPPFITRQVVASKKTGLKLDFFGFALLALGFGALEFVLDKGQCYGRGEV